jgi:Cof subfamily protein (haloacid dehalogenase superfamily)
MIRLLVTDVDGTLLDNNSEIPELNKQALIDCKKQNIDIILATGKSIGAVIPIIRTLDLKLPQITLNGAVVVDRSSNVINAVKIEPSHFYSVIKTIKTRGYNPLIALPDGTIFYEKYDRTLEVFKDINEPIFKTEHIEKADYADNCVSISVAIREDDPLDSYLRAKFSDVLQIVRSGEYFFDILHNDATKGNALGFICNIYGIKKNEIAVFGDSYNDLSMFDHAGLRIAVRNSYPEVIKRADYITEENFNSGLGKAIYKHILK